MKTLKLFKFLKNLKNNFFINQLFPNLKKKKQMKKINLIDYHQLLNDFRRYQIVLLDQNLLW